MKKTVLLAMSLGLLLLSAKTGAMDYNWSAWLRNNDTWFSGAEARAIADSIVKYQLADGGWRKDMANTGQTGEWAKSTIDNDATISQIIFLARVYRQTNNSAYLTSCRRGIDLLLNAQYDNGGWPQIFGAGSATYHRHITFNDGAMVQVLELLKSVSEKSGHFAFMDDARAARAKNAVDRGVECILNTQIVFNSGEVTAWCQQYNSITLAPAGGRAYELPSVSGSESVGVVNFLKSYHASLGDNPRLDVVRAINAAVTWMDKVKIVGIRVNNITTNGQPDRVVVSDPASTLWARFYELQTNRPIFVGRDGIIRYSLAEIEQERRAGYAYYGNWPRHLVAAGLLPEPDTATMSARDRTTPASHALNVSYAGKGGMLNVNYSIKEKGAVRVDLFDIKGNRVRTLINTVKAPGAYNERISANGLAAGTYVVKLKTGQHTLRKRVSIMTRVGTTRH
jgi:PelA/Pel-15E family pectate lyase